MLSSQTKPFASVMITLALLFAAGTCVSGAVAGQDKKQKDSPPPPAKPTSLTTTSATNSPSRYRPAQLSPHAIEHYQTIWGVDSFVVRTVESGQMIRFSYRVIDAKKAAAVNEKKSVPYLIDEAANVKLVVPNMEKVGELRQSSTPEEGKSYWMVFSNKGGFVKRGDRVSVEIGKFRVDGLVID
jgi:hypothetical protein